MLALLVALSLQTAEASDNPKNDFLAVAGITALTQVGGAVALGGTGLFVGGLSCSRPGAAGECYAPAAGLAGGMGAGVLVGGPLGAALGARAVHARPGRTAAYAAVVEGAAIGLIALGAVNDQPDLATSGVVVGLLGPSLAAGIAAASDPGPRPPKSSLSIAPVVGRQKAGLVLSGRF